MQIALSETFRDEIPTITKAVYKILSQDPLSRADDMYLTKRVFETQQINLCQTLEEAIDTGILNTVGSISRIRRKLQQQYPELIECNCYERRQRMKEQYKQYFKGDLDT